ncbi:MAG: hypothetical protein K5886_10925 [Lachnospiraceae bacterium]|nr:hypothetical protein [Lachnospiraceae bacterium]
MKQLAEMLGNSFPQFASALTGIIFIVFLVLQISDDYDKIVKFIKRLFDFRKYIDTLIYKKKREGFNRVLADHDFLGWQFELMKVIYGPLIEKKDEELKKHGGSIGFSTIKLDDSNGRSYSYESVSIRMPRVPYPFTGVCPKKELRTSPGLENAKIADLDKAINGGIITSFKRQIRRYYAMIRATIRYPRRLGYMLGEIVQDGSEAGKPGWHLTAYSGVYEHNVRTSHILEYEIYRLYKRVKHRKEWKSENLAALGRDRILKELPIREHLHKQFIRDGDESDILISGKHRASLMGVQAFVLIKNKSGSYDALRIRRSENVAAKPGFLQFIPSGGFEAMNDCTDFDSQWDNYSLTKAIFRELLEECFGQDEDDKHATGNNVSPDRLYSNEQIKKLVEMLENTEADRPNAEMALLGTTMNLVGLRQELSFILRVDDPSFSGKLIANYESRTAVQLVDICHMEEYGFWVRPKEEQTEGQKGKKGRRKKGKNKEQGENDLENLNCTSAGLFELARESSIYKEALEHGESKDDLVNVF